MSVRISEFGAIHCGKCSSYLGKKTKNQRKNLLLTRMADSHKCTKWE